VSEAPPLVLRDLASGIEHRVDQFPYQIGRGSGCDLVVADGQASRTHAVLLLEGDEVIVVDENSSNGTFVNDLQVTRERLGKGDVIRIGACEIGIVDVNLGASNGAPRREIVLTRRVQRRDQTGRLVPLSPVPEIAQYSSDSTADVAALALVYRLAGELGRIASKEELWVAAASFVREVAADSSIAFLADPGDARGRSFGRVIRPAGDAAPISASVVEEAVARGVLVVSRDTLSGEGDPRGRRRSRTYQALRSVLCVPFFQDRSLRLVCYVASRQAVLSETQADLLATICAQTYLAFERLDAVERLIAYGRQIAQSDRLASIGKLVATLAHEIRTPLTVARGEIELVQLEMAGAGHDQRLDRALAALDRVTEILGHTLSYAREAPSSKARLDVVQAVEPALQLIEHELALRCKLVRAFSPSPTVFAEEARLGQVVLNLVRNAFDAFDPERRADNRLMVEVRPEGQNQTCLVVADNGPGIPAEVLPRIFDPFYTTRGDGRGTGLGLAICRDLVIAMHGTIAVESQVGSGTRFTVLLPGWNAAMIDDRTHT